MSAGLRCPSCGWTWFGGPPTKCASCGAQMPTTQGGTNGPGQAPTGGAATNPGVGAVAGSAAGAGAEPEQGASPGLAIDALGPLDGWRAWRAPAGEGTLHSIWATAKWEPGKNEARCLRNQMMASGYLPAAEPSPPHEVPSRIGSGHRCGFYACLGPDFEAMNGESPLSFREAVSVFGRVELWGRVYTYEKGYRAQYARITALVRLWKPEHEVAMLTLAERYGVSIEVPPAGLGRWVEEMASAQSTGGGLTGWAAQFSSTATSQRWMSLSNVTITGPAFQATYGSPTALPEEPETPGFWRLLRENWRDYKLAIAVEATALLAALFALFAGLRGW